MLEHVAQLFRSLHPRRKASLAMTRILNRFEIEQLPFVSGVRGNRRIHEDAPAALGVWISAINPEAADRDIDLSTTVPAITRDVRAEGFGVLTPVSLEGECFVVAVPDGETSWRFFVAEMRHNTPLPGNWFQLGLRNERMLDPTENQSRQFRQHIKEFQPAE